MKRILDFQNKKMSIKNMNCIFGGASSCTYTEDCTKGHCKDVKSSTYDDDGNLVDISERITECEEVAN